MQKIVVNKCYGGFGLSEAGIRAYAKRKGLTLYPEDNKFSSMCGPTWWKVPPEERPATLEGSAWYDASLEERRAYNEAYSACVLTDRNFARDDVDLVAVVEALGDKASGKFAQLEVTEIPEGVAWVIEEYDGREWVSEVHRTW